MTSPEITDPLADARGRVWIVEDSALEAEAARRALEGSFDVTIFADGPSMLERLSPQGGPDVVLLDWHLPALSGIEVCRFLRTKAADHDLGILIVTGVYAKPEDVVQGFAAGADDYVVKPYAEAALNARVGALVRAKQLRKRTVRAEVALRAVLDQLPDPLLVVDAQGVVRSANQEAQRLFVRGQAPHGHPLVELVPGLTIGGGVVEFEARTYQCAARQVVLTEGADPMTILTLRDVTEARRQITARDEFLAMLAHELRNPLAPISTALEIMKLGVDRETGVRSRDIMERQVTRLVRLVDDLIDISRVTRGAITLQRQPTDVSALLSRCVENVQPLLDAQRHRLSVDTASTALHVDADPVRLEQVFTNLLHNAAKYTPAGGRVGVQARVEDGQVVVRVSDDGIGIAPDMLPQIFELFVQVDTSIDRSRGGLGIGLTLAKQLVEMLGGTIDGTSPGRGKGSTFTVRLPALTAPQIAAPVAPKATRKQDGRRVLVVDDNADAAEMMAQALEMHGHQVKIATEGLAALETALAFAPEVVLLDIGLPEMDGYEVARRLRLADASAQLFIIAVTGYGSADDKDRSKQAGIDHHLVKPIELRKLQAILADRFTSLA